MQKQPNHSNQKTYFSVKIPPFQVRRRHRADDRFATPSLLDAVLEVHLPNRHANDLGGVLYRAGFRGKQLSGLEPADRQHGQPRVAPLVRGGRDSARLRVHPVDSRRGHLSVSSGNSQLSKQRAAFTVGFVFLGYVAST